jgi:pimeloyl-ACP methyl ester carboxylesterase
MWESLTIATDRLDVPALAAGDGPPLLALHGFPDHPATFTPLAEHLVADGWRVVAPFLRGYHPEAMPPEPYFDIGTLTADTAALCAALSPDASLPIIGHDWGGFMVYGMASAFPERLAAGIVMAVPPAEAAASAFLSPEQLRRSFYIWLFQQPGYAEAAMADGALVDFLWRTWSPGLQVAPHREQVQEVFSDPDRVTAAIGYYRAMLSGQHHDPHLAELRERIGRRAQVPLLVLGGADDGALSPQLLAGALDVLPDGSRVDVIDGVGHFLHLEQPAEVARRVRDWLASSAEANLD